MSNTEHLTTDINADADQQNLGASLLEAALFGETAEPAAETGSVPATTPEDVKADAGTTSPDPVPSEPVVTPPATEPTPPVEENAENSVVLAKDGKHTIPYERLQETREQVQQYKQQVEQLTAQLAAQQTPGNTQVAQQNAAVAEAVIEASGNNADVMAMFGDFSEEAIAKGVEALVSQRVSAQVQSMMDAALAPFKQQQQLSAEQQHFAYIGSSHPDYESIPESQEFQAWKDAQPSFIRSAYEDVLNKGSAEQVVELLSLYKSQNNVSPKVDTPAPTQAMVEKAKQAVQNAPSKVPHSVTDLPAGSPAALSADERLSNLSGPELLAEMENWSPDQVEAYMSRRA
ncbi:hypothetical protein F899_01635 [Acinetobacter sp. CIP 101934]|uniref:hypothetical protein n=1 Tax=Acinetobacter sp. CIP 101934 TaxID=1144661 RepID=UPI0002CFF431|nr:hypothetical protein [Acinetobacter sp. CIP 101934]ENX01002.1 hypothetical protein F899_01635 [Acinetobacter sp. CIP 101934]